MRRLVSIILAASLGFSAFASAAPVRPVEGASDHAMPAMAEPCECPPDEAPCDMPDGQDCGDALACAARCIAVQAMLPPGNLTIEMPIRVQGALPSGNDPLQAAAARPPLPPPRG